MTITQKEKSVLPEKVEHWSLTTPREKIIKIGAKVARLGRYITFELAEVAIPRELFAEILWRIDGLRPAPCRHDQARLRSIQTARHTRCVSRVS